MDRRPAVLPLNLDLNPHVRQAIHFQDGATDLGNAVYTFTLGTLNTTTTFSENFDGVTAPNLPLGWVATNAAGAAPLTPRRSQIG